MKKLSLASLAIAAALSLPAFAAPETYAFDANHTVARFEYVHFGYTNQIQRFDKTTGKVIIDRAAKTGSVDVTIDANSINTGVEVFNGHLKGEDFFNTAKFPAITFKSTAFKFDGERLASVDGNLTVKGVTKPVTLTVTSFVCKPHPLAKKDACGANATASIKRSDFNAGKYAPAVSDEVTISLAVEAFKE